MHGRRRAASRPETTTSASAPTRTRSTARTSRPSRRRSRSSSTCRTSSRRRSARRRARANRGSSRRSSRTRATSRVSPASSRRRRRRRTRRASSALSAGEIRAEPPIAAAPPDYREPGRFRRSLAGGAFLAPAFFLLGVWLVFPTVYTVIRSFFGQTGFLGHCVGIDNYKTLFTTSTLTTAIKNNAIWVAVVPALVTALGLIFAVLTERVRWAVAFKTAVFLPMAISAFATGVTWRIMYQQDPGLGAINGLSRPVSGGFSPARRL